jgi:hypothetical protein
MASSGHDVGLHFIGDSATTESFHPAIDVWCYNDSGAIIAAGQAVSVDLSKTPRMTRIRRYTGTPATDGVLIVGGTPRAIPIGELGLVRVRGILTGQNLATGVTAGLKLVAGAAAGRLKAAAAYAVDEREVALCTVAEASNLGEVYYYGSPLHG